MRKQIFYIVWMSCVGMGMLPGCKEEQKLEQPPAETPSEGTGEIVYLDGYARPDGVLILNQGARAIENSSITYLAPDGAVEEGVYRKVNGTALGNEVQDMWMYNGKLYILSDGMYAPNGEEGDGVLVVADAVTLKREKAYKLDDLKFKRPEGSKDEDELISLSIPFENIAVLDEKNIFSRKGRDSSALTARPAK